MTLTASNKGISVLKAVSNPVIETTPDDISCNAEKSVLNTTEGSSRNGNIIS